MRGAAASEPRLRPQSDEKAFAYLHGDLYTMGKCVTRDAVGMCTKCDSCDDEYPSGEMHQRCDQTMRKLWRIGGSVLWFMRLPQ